MTRKAGYVLLGLMFAGSVLAGQPAKAKDGREQGTEVARADRMTLLTLVQEFANQPLFQILEAFQLLYASDTAETPDLSVKVTGRQFAWQYEYSIPYGEKQAGACAVTGPLAVPLGKRIEVMVTSEDVIHEWIVPALGAKVDAIPGRLNVIRLDTSKPGRFTGGSTKTSGKGFEAMTIEVMVMQPEVYASWVRENLEAKGCARQASYLSSILHNNHLDGRSYIAGLQ